MTKSKFKKIAVALLSAVGMTTLSVGVSGCLPKSTDLTVPENVEIARYAPPADGSLPTAHTCAENLAYINYVFDHQTQYHTYSYGVTSASIATQTTRNFRDYKDGILMNTDLTYSSMVKSGTQTCSMYNAEGEYEVYFRTSEAPGADTLPAQAKWSGEAPTFFNERSYNYTYGLTPNELFNYIVNEQNIIDSEQIKVNGDGTYTQNFTLDPVASTYYYQFGMKTRGGLSGFPEFESITFSVTFDGSWQILSSEMHEVSKVNKGIVVTSVSDFTTKYWYNGENFDEEHFAFYESYFKTYVGGGSNLEQGGNNDEKLTIDVTNVLSNGFSQIMNGGAQFEVALNLGANRYVGYVFVSLDLADPLGSLALKASLGKSLKEQTLYIEYGNGEMAAYYGDDFALTGNLAEVKLALDEFNDVIDKINAAFTKSGETISNGGAALAEESDPLTDLMNSMVLTAGEKQAVLTLNTDDLLGTGIGINARLVFGINSNAITFRSANIGGLSVGGEDIDFGVSLFTTTAPQISREPSETAADLADYIADVHSLLGADIIKVTANIDGDGEKVSIDALKGIGAKVTAYADLSGLTVGATADVSYTYRGKKLSAKAEIWYGYDPNGENYGNAVVALSEFNGSPVDLRIKCDIKEVAEAVSTLVTFAGGDGGAATQGLAEMLNRALSSDLSSLITELYADKTQIKAGVSVDALLNMLGIDAGVKFGSCALKYQRGEGVYGGELTAALPALGFDISVVGESGRVVMPDTSDCLDLIYVIDDVKSLMNAQLLTAEISLDGSAKGVTLTELSGIKADVDVQFDPAGLAVAAGIDFAYTYNGQTISAKLTAYYEKGDSKYGNIALSLTELNGTPVSVCVRGDIAKLAETITTLINNSGANTKQLSLNGIDLNTVLENLLGADFAELLPLLETDADGLRVAINADELLSVLGVNAGMRFGNVNLAYSHSGANMLVAQVPALGLSVNLNGAAGELAKPAPENYLDLAYAVEDVKSLLTADLIKAQISLDGSGDSVTLKELSGVKADLTAYLDSDGIAAAADIDVSYTYQGKTVSASLTAYYENIKDAENAGKYGEIILSLTAINGKAVNAKVYCNIDDVAEAVKTLLNYANVQLKPFEMSGGSVELDGILTKLVQADFAKLLTVLEADGSGARVGVNVDEALKLFGVNTNLQLGNVSLAYNRGNSDELLVANVPALGLSATVCGAKGQLTKPDIKDCLDLTKLVNTVNAVWEQVNGIIDSQSIAFEIKEGETFLSLDGILVEVSGKGEVSWKAGEEYVALDLVMSITESGTDSLAFKIFFDKNAAETPLVKLALNNVGLEIYQKDIESVKSGFNDIYNKVIALFGGNGGAATSPEQPAQNNVQSGEGAVSGAANHDKLIGVLFGALASDGWVDFLNDFTLSSDGTSFALKYLSDNAVNVEVAADGKLSLYYDGRFGERFSLGGGIEASAAGEGNLRTELDKKFELCNMSSTKSGTAGFVKLAYDFLFEAVSSISVENILGANTYTVKFNLNGNNTNIPELKDIFVNAELYFTGSGDSFDKMTEGELNIDAAGVVIRLNVKTERQSGNTYFYINLHQVMDVALPDLKVTATQQSLYDTIDVLIKTVNNTDVLDVIGKFMGVKDGETMSDSSAAAESGEDKTLMPESTTDKIADIITKILNFDLNSAVYGVQYVDENGEIKNDVLTTDNITHAYIDLDNIVSQLGFETGALGTVEVEINHDSHSIKTSGTTLVTDLNGNTELKEWISLSSELAARRDYSKFDRGEYISIEFLPTLIEDLVKTATDENGNMHDIFTLSGSVDVDLVKIITLKIENATLTVGFDSGSDFYFSFVGYLTNSSLITKGVIGVTYQNGYLTLGRNLSSANPEYRVMTFDYFIDNMFAKGSTSTLNWLIGANNTIWNMVVSGLGDLVGDINSGLTTPQDVYLYKAQNTSENYEISMFDYINALRIVINGNEMTKTGDYSTLESKLGVSDNYYGVDLNAGLMTGDILTTLYAAILRNDTDGISGVKASGSIQSYVTFGADLQYKEDWRTEYEIGAGFSGGVTAPSLYGAALAKVAEIGYTPDFGHFEQKPDQGYDEKFGCLNISGGTCTEEYSRMLYSHMLTVIDIDGGREERLVRHGSTIHLYDNGSPVYTDETKNLRLLYSLSPDEVGAPGVIMNGDLTVYAVRRAAVTVVVHNGSEEYAVSSFVGDRVPTSVKGLETIGSPVYADGTPVGANDTIDGSVSTLHVYGTFVNSEAVVNYVKYTFSSETMSYTASGKAAGFNDYYSTKGNTLVLENELGGYPVTAIAANAFANTDGKPIKSVIVPENIVTVGENAFLGNVDMRSAVFLAENVTFLGKDGSSKTMPFYGCAISSDEEATQLKVYYNNITASGGNWKHFFYVNKVFNFNSYIDEDGGAVYGKGSWQYVDYSVNVDLNGVSGGTLSEEAVKNILAPYFPYATTGSYAGSLTETSVNKAMENGIAGFTVLRGGITYACVYTAEVSVQGGRTTVTFNVSYQATADIYVTSPLAFSMYGRNIAADTLTLMTVPVEGETIALPSPTDATHVFVRWEITENAGKPLYTAVWREKATYTLTLKLKRGFTDTNRVHVVTNGVKPSEGIRVNGGSTSAATVTTVVVYEGQALFGIANNELTIVTGDITYVIYVNEAKIGGSDTGNKRSGLQSTLTGGQNISGNIELTLSYS